MRPGLKIAAIALCSATFPPANFLVAGSLSDQGKAEHDELQTVPQHPMYLGTVNSGVKGNDSYIDGNFSIVAPIWSSLGSESTLSGGLLYLEPYISYGEGGEVAVSLGLGYRHLFGTQSLDALTHHDGHQAGFFEEGAYLGANVFVDMLDTEVDNRFWQLGVGLEAGTRYLEVRGNYYIPLSDKKLAEEQRTRETFSSTHTSSGVITSQAVAPSGGAAPHATGNSIIQDAQFTSYSTRVTRTTTTTTTIERLFQRFEEGMEGWDAEIAILVPVIDRYMDVMLIGGYYSFDNQPFGPQEGGAGNVEGWKAGIEVRPVPALVLSGTWYEDERLTGGDWTVGVQMQIPFEAGDLGDGKNFWSRIGDAFTPRRRHLIERLAEPVARQNAAVKIANTVKQSQKVVSQQSGMSMQRATRVVAQSQGQVVLADDVVFVNNGAPVGNGILAGDTIANGANGTAERPFNTITEGATQAGTFANANGKAWTVYTQGGTGTDYSGVVNVTGSTKFVSSFHPLIGAGGVQFGGGTVRPILNGRFVATSIPFLQITAYDIRGGNPNGIGATNVQDLIVTDNLFQATGWTPVQVTTNGSTIAQSLVSGNRITGTVGNPAIFFTNAGTASSQTAIIAGNEIDGNYINGISFSTIGGGTIHATVRDNTLTGSYSASGIIASASASSGSISNVHLDAFNNTLSGTFVAGIRYQSTGTGTSTVGGTAEGNVLDGTFTDGVLLTAASSTTANVTVTDNELSGTFTNGITVDRPAFSAAIMTATISGNVLSGTISQNGVFLNLRGVAGTPVTATITDNVFEGSFGRGINFDVRAGTSVNAVVSNNLFATGSSYTSDAIRFSTFGSVASFLSVTGFDGNLIEGTSVTGIRIDAAVGAISVNGTLDAALGDQVTNETGNKLENTGAALTSGHFYLNGVPITLPATVP